YERFADYVPRPYGTPDWTAGPKVVNFDRVEWHVLPDASTAASALRLGEMDWWELPPPDLVPMLRKDRALKVEVQDPTGFIGIFRMNHLNPPFDNPAIRRALLGAIDQTEFMQAAGGTDPSGWRDGVGYFCPGTPMASDAGMEALTAPRDLSKVSDALKAAGYRGEKIVLLGATDITDSQGSRGRDRRSHATGGLQHRLRGDRLGNGGAAAYPQGAGGEGRLAPLQQFHRRNGPDNPNHPHEHLGGAECRARLAVEPAHRGAQHRVGARTRSGFASAHRSRHSAPSLRRRALHPARPDRAADGVSRRPRRRDARICGVLERQARLRRRMHQAKDIPVVRENRVSIRVPIMIARSAGQSLQQLSG
ncbi:MAG: hypothetical protein JOZ88_05870, partial [Hyphomicrobiales bacterium]|nr:hypothetical protein [Hyphomicrobiales bacterium]